MGLLIPNHVWRKILGGGGGGGEEGKREGMEGSQRRRSVISCFLSWSWWYPSGYQAARPSCASPNPPLLPIPLLPRRWWWIDLTQQKWRFNTHIFWLYINGGWDLSKVFVVCCVYWEVFHKNTIQTYPKPKICIFICMICICLWVHVCEHMCITPHVCGCICVCVHSL